MDIQIDDFTEEVKENPYTEHVKALNEAGEGKSLTLVVADKDVKKSKFKFGKAANAIGKTARIRVTEPLGDGKTRIVFTLTEKHKPRRRKNTDAK
jgi:hypothetical protein